MTTQKDNDQALIPEVLEPQEKGSLLSPDELDPFGDTSQETEAIQIDYPMVPLNMDTDAMLAADPLTLYLAHLRQLEPLTAEQQQALAERYFKAKDVEAAKLLILSNVRLVVKIAREYRRQRESLMELIQEGNVGLAEAIRRYDPYRGVKFTSYAQYWIRAMILNYLMNVIQPVRIGSTRAGRKLFFNLRRERESLMQEINAQPSTKLLADRLGVEEKEVVDVMRVIDAPPVSIDAPVQGYDQTPLVSMLEDKDAPTPEDNVIRNSFRTQLHEALLQFGQTISDEREKAIWSERVLSETPLSLHQLGERFGVSRERVRQIEVKLKGRVESFLKDRFGEDDIQLVVLD